MASLEFMVKTGQGRGNCQYRRGLLSAIGDGSLICGGPFGRALIVDPQWLTRCDEGRFGDILPLQPAKP